MKLSAQVNFFNNVSTLEKVLFTKHLAVMVKSGIPLVEAFETLKEQTVNPYFKSVLQKILTEINNGQNLAKSLAKFPKVFDNLYLSLVDIGEQSGNLEANLEYLANLMKKNYEFSKKVQGAMLYPGIVLSATGIIGLGLALFVLPKLTDLFNSLEVKLPLSTKILLFIAQIMKNYGIIIVPGIFILTFLFFLIVKTPKVKPTWHKFLLSLPILGPLLQNIELANFCRNLGIMLKSGLPVTTALEAQSEASTNLVYKHYVETLLKGVSKGNKLSEVMSSKEFKQMPLIVSKMIGVGEKTGKLEESLIYLGEFFEDEVDSTTKNLSTILEPILLLGIGIVVAFVALAIISPIYQLTGSIRR